MAVLIACVSVGGGYQILARKLGWPPPTDAGVPWLESDGDDGGGDGGGGD